MMYDNDAKIEIKAKVQHEKERLQEPPSYKKRMLKALEKKKSKIKLNVLKYAEV